MSKAKSKLSQNPVNPHNTVRGWLGTAAVIGLALALYLSMTIVVTVISGNPYFGAIAANLLIFGVGVWWLKREDLKGNSPLVVRPYTELKRNQGFWALAGGALVLAWIVGQSLTLWLYANLGSASFDRQVQSKGEVSIALVLLVTVVLAPMAEEMLMRGIAYTQLRKHLPPFLAAIVTAVLFSVLHVNLVQLAVALPLGLLLAAVYEHTGRLLPVVLMHAVFNLASLVIRPAVIAPLASPMFVIIGMLGFALVLTSLYMGAGAKSEAVFTKTQGKL